MAIWVHALFAKTGFFFLTVTSQAQEKHMAEIRLRETE